MLNQIPSEDLIARYLAGEATSQEANEVLSWAKESDTNAKQLEEYRKTWELSANVPIADVNIDAAWRKVKIRIQDIEQTQPKQAQVIPLKKSGTSIFLRIAAGVILVFGLGSLLFYINQGERIKTISAENQAIEIYLPDSTYILLEPHSTLSYNTDEYGKSERKTDLKGAANYSVQKNAAAPFIVNVGKAEVMVLGTSFRIREGNKDESVEVAVVTGKVKFSGIKEPFGQNKTTEVILLPGMQGVMDENSGEITVDTVSVENIRFKLHNTLVFEKTDLKEVCQTLSSVFGRNIKLDSDKLNNCMLTATFKNQKLLEILDIIANTFSLTIKEQSNEFSLDGEGCL
jgi:transmembrane sensor